MTELEQIVAEALASSLPNVCSACERVIVYEKYGDPVKEVADAIEKVYFLSPVSRRCVTCGMDTEFARTGKPHMCGPEKIKGVRK